jgi:CelD/BcsL family acetyltransferase involved in cellulose biosynthesis
MTKPSSASHNVGAQGGRPMAGSSRTATGFAIETSSNPEDFENLKTEWEQLCLRSSIDCPFVRPGWFRAWWQAFGQGHRLQLTTLRKNGQLLGVLPLMLVQSRVYGIPCRRLGAISNDHSPRFDLVLDNQAVGIYQAAWDSLMASQSNWDILELPQLLASSETLVHFRQFARQDRLRHSVWNQLPGSPWISTQSGWSAYLEDRSKSFRKSLRRKLRSMANEGMLALETLTDSGSIAQALEDGFRIEASGWKSNRKTAISAQTEAMHFYTKLAYTLAEQGNLRLHFLTLDQKRIAFDYSILRNQRLYSLKSGLDIRHARHSPGTLLLYLILRQSHQEDLLEVDLLGTADSFKLSWTRNVRPSQWLMLYAGSVRGRALYWMKCSLIPGIKKLMLAANA